MNELCSADGSLTERCARRDDHAGLVFALIALSVLLGILVNFYTELPPVLVRLVLYLPLLFGYAGIAAYIALFRGKSRERYLLRIWVLAGAYLVAVGLLRFQLFTDPNFQSSFLNQDLRYFMYAGCGVILSNPRFRGYMVRLLAFIGALSVVFGLLALRMMNLDLIYLQARLQVWSLPYYFWWLSGNCYAFNYAWMRMSGRNKAVGMGAFLAYTVCGALFLKKVVIANALMMILVCEWLAPKRRGTRGLVRGAVSGIVLLGFLSLLIFLLSQTVGLIAELVDFFRVRIEQAADSYDRFVELKFYFAQADVSEVLFGKGFGNYAYLPAQYRSGTYLANALHIGFADVLYVGGIPYCILWLGILFGVIRRIPARRSMDSFETTCLAVSLLTFCSMLYELSRGILIGPVFYFTAISTVLCLPPSGRRTEESHENLL